MKTQRSINKLVIFVKAPRLGQVKSRLAASIGEPATCDAYKKIAAHLLENLRGLENVEIRFSPDDAENELRKWLGDDFDFARQSSGDLGERMHGAFQKAFAAGNERVVMIGSDCPYVTRQDVASAWKHLETHDIVLGPAMDGGYWLIGLRQPQPALFENMAWSTENVLETTLSRIRVMNLSYHCLRCLNDIDTENDWNCYLENSVKTGSRPMSRKTDEIRAES